MTERLRADGIDLVDVPAKLARRVRLLSSGRDRKSDETDALSGGVAACSARSLNTVAVDEAIAALRALTEHRDDLVRMRTQTLNRLHARLVTLVPSGLGPGLTTETAAPDPVPLQKLASSVDLLLWRKVRIRHAGRLGVFDSFI